MATYKLRFLEPARKEWNKLDSTVRRQFEKKLAERLVCPHVPASKLSGLPDCYKIKLRDVGYRMVYRVEDDIVYVTVIAVGRRDGAVYDKANERR